MDTLFTSKNSYALAGEVDDIMIKYNITYEQAVKVVHLNHNLPGSWHRLSFAINHLVDKEMYTTS